MFKHEDKINKIYTFFHEKEFEKDGQNEHIGEFAEHISKMSDNDIAYTFELEDDEYEDAPKIRQYITDGAEAYFQNISQSLINGVIHGQANL